MLVPTVSLVAQPDPAAAAPAAGRLVGIVLLIAAVLGLGLYLARRAAKSAGISRAQRTRSAAEREEAFMAMTLAMHEARKRQASPPGESATAPDAAPAFAGDVHCPACGASLGAAGPLLRYVTKCPACARRVAALVEGARVRVEVDG